MINYDKYYNLYKTKSRMFSLNRSRTGLTQYYHFYLIEQDINTLPSVIKNELKIRKNLIRQYERNGEINSDEMKTNINSLRNTQYQIIGLILKIEIFYKRQDQGYEQYLFLIPRELFFRLLNKTRQKINVLPEDLTSFKKELLEIENIEHSNENLNEETQITFNLNTITIPRNKLQLLRKLLSHLLKEEVENREIEIDVKTSYSPLSVLFKSPRVGTL